MNETTIYKDIAMRTKGSLMIGVVGPVRTGKSTFIKQFMEKLVIPQIENTYMRERAKDELPQSGSGKTIMTAEPKFVPEDAVNITIEEGAALSVRLADCVGYMVEGAAGQFENGEERLVTTPWFNKEVTISEAAEKGTHKVITEHSTVAIVVTTDGSFGEIPRENYLEAEARAINELKSTGKPFVVLLNSDDPKSEKAVKLSLEIEDKFSVKCIPVSCAELSENEILKILALILGEFPLKAMEINLPDWIEALDDASELKKDLFSGIVSSAEETFKVSQCKNVIESLLSCACIDNAEINGYNYGEGIVKINIAIPASLYYETISKKTGLEIHSDRDMISALIEMSEVKDDYYKVKEALDNVRKSGYGVVMPDRNQMKLEEPQIVRQSGKYTVKLRASAPAIHMIMTDVETDFTPAIGGETASEDIIGFLLQGFDGDANRIWESNIFGRSLNDIAEEGLYSKLNNLPENSRERLRCTLQRIVNEGSTGLICILL